MREQKGYIFRKGRSWFVRYYDDLLQAGGAIKRTTVCKKLKVDYCDEYRTKASVKPFAQEFLAPVNGGILNPQSTMPVSEFVEKVYLKGVRREATESRNAETIPGRLARSPKELHRQADAARIPHRSR